MRILIVTQWYLPEPVGYISELAETIMAEGHQVSILTAFPNWPYGRLYEGYKQSLFFSENINGIEVYRSPLYPDHSNSGFTRAINTLSSSASSVAVGVLVWIRTMLF